MELYDLEEVRTAKRGKTHYVVSNMNQDVNRYAMWMWGYHLGDGKPLCAQRGIQRAPLPGAKVCSVCEGTLESLDGSFTTPARSHTRSRRRCSATDAFTVVCAT